MVVASTLLQPTVLIDSRFQIKHTFGGQSPLPTMYGPWWPLQPTRKKLEGSICIYMNNTKTCTEYLQRDVY